MKINNIKRMFLFDKHRYMERFGLLFILTVILLTIPVGMAFARDIERKNISLSNDAVLTTKFTFSRSGISGDVRDIYSNKSGTRLLMLLYINDINSMSTDADNYQIYFSGYNSSGHNTFSQNFPAGAIHMFGNSGYIGLEFLSSISFVPQISDIWLWNTMDLTGLAPANPDGDIFERYDTARIFANLGASGTTHLSLLDSEYALNVVDFFAEVIATKDLEKIIDELDSVLLDMQVSLTRIDEIRTRLEREGVIVPDDPSYMMGDSIIYDNDDNLIPVFAAPMPGGYDFAWRDRTISDGFIELVVNNREELRGYMREMDIDGRHTGRTMRFNIDWRYTDGSPVINPDASVITDRKTEILSNIKALESEWQNFEALKRKYKINLLRDLLVLDENTRDRIIGYTVRNDEETLIIW